MPYTPTKFPTSIKSSDAIDDIGLWAIGPTNFLNSNVPAPNLFSFYTSNTSDNVAAMQVLNGSGQTLYQTQIAGGDTVLPVGSSDGHNETPLGVYSFGFGPRLDLVVVQTAGTASKNVEVFVLYGAPYVSGSNSYDAYQAYVAPASASSSLPTFKTAFQGPGFNTGIPTANVPYYQFRVGDFLGTGRNDLYCIQTANTPSKLVEVTVLTGWSLKGMSLGGLYNTPLLSSAQINVPTSASEGDTTNANDYRWLPSAYGGRPKMLYAVKVRNLRQPKNPGQAIELYQVDFSKGANPAELSFMDFLPVEGFYDADYAFLNLHWLMSDNFGLYAVNTHNADNPDLNPVEVWSFQPAK